MHFNKWTWLVMAIFALFIVFDFASLITYLSYYLVTGTPYKMAPNDVAAQTVTIQYNFFKGLASSTAITYTIPVRDTKRKPYCPILPDTLLGPLHVNLNATSYAAMEARYPDLHPGGWWVPTSCAPRIRVAIIVPYRDREYHLKIFLAHLHSFLQRQKLEYAIFVVEQADEWPFNRAMLFNIGYEEANKLFQWDCYIFHDVDLLPENDRNMYRCHEQPLLMAVALDTMGYKPRYRRAFGGVCALSREHMQKVDGFSNIYFGWGAEDNDMFLRIHHAKLKSTMSNSTVARYKRLPHVPQECKEERWILLKWAKTRFGKDGLSSLNYTLLKTTMKKLFTHVVVSLNQTEIQSPFPETRLKASPDKRDYATSF